MEFWSSIELNKYRFRTIQTFEEDIRGFINDPAHSYDKFSTYKSSNMTIGRFSLGLNQIAEADKKYLSEIEGAVALVTSDYLNSYQRRNVVSSVHVINMCNTFGSIKYVKISKDSDFFKNFKKAVLEHIHRFPERVDMAIGLLNLCFDKIEDFKEIGEISDAILSSSPDHPVGLWFKGLSDLSLGKDRIQAVEKMRLAVNKGLSRYMPVPTELLQGLGVQQQAEIINQTVKNAIK